jgi:hypothetical protein
VALSEDGERVPIFRIKGAFRSTLDGRQLRFVHLGEAEAFAAGWLLRGEGDRDGGCE